MVEIAYHHLPRSYKDFLLLQGFYEQEGSIATLLDISQRIETMDGELKVVNPVPENVIAPSPTNRTNPPIRNRRLDSFMNIKDLTSPTVPRIIRRLKLFYIPPINLVTRNTEQMRLRPALLLLMTTRNGSAFKSPGMVRPKTSICKQSGFTTALPRRLQKNTLLST